MTPKTKAIDVIFATGNVSKAVSFYWLLVTPQTKAIDLIGYG